MFKYNDKIERNILEYLQGWKTKPLNDSSENIEEEDEGISGELTRIIDESENNIFTEALEEVELQATKIISSDELELYWDKTLLLAEAYLQRNINSLDLDTDSRAVCNACEMWCAGLIWKKYNLRVVDQEEDTNIVGYGDQLVVNAKNTLKNYQYFYVTAF